jgi:[acyl-carrier-protein] S-malonyltransferase
MKKTAYIFPGQGSQAVGMGKYLYDHYDCARTIFDEADRLLKISLSGLCFEGPEEDLQQTINVQPAIFVTSLACLEVARKIAPDKFRKSDLVAGHSLGEYTALVVAGVLDFKDALLLIRERGRLMQEAGLIRPGGMLAIIGTPMNIIEGICARSGTVISNINSPGQIVISGSSEGLQKVKEICDAEGIRRIIPLKVSGAFHSPLLESAATGLRKAINNLNFNDASIPVISNITANDISEAQDIKTELVNQILECVQWQKSVENIMANGVTQFIEFGHGQVLVNLIKRINPNVMLYNIDDEHIETQVKEYLNTGSMISPSNK